VHRKQIKGNIATATITGLGRFSGDHCRFDWVPQRRTFGDWLLLVQDLLQAGCAFHHPTNSMKALDAGYWITT